MTVQPQGERLAPGELVERVRRQRPGEEVVSLQFSADPADAAVVGFAPKDGGRRGERRHLDPYTGELLGQLRHQAFFRTTMRLHRWLVADDIGKKVVGASTRSEEHTSELQSLMRISYAVLCLKKQRERTA